MNRRQGLVVFIAVIIGLASGAATPAKAQDPGLVARLLAAINADRVANGLPPYALNPLLTLSAQRHSEYQASIGTFTHDGPDGSRALQRAQAVGYPATWANENVYMGHTTPEEVVNWWYTADQLHRNNILHAALREVGLGIASDAQGMTYWTMDISAQPNVLPIFINSGAYSTNSPTVTLTLYNEKVFSSEPGQIGPVVQVMISNSPDFAGAAPQGWAQYVNWTLDTSNASSTKTAYVRFIDGAGRTADSQATIIYQGDVGNLFPANPSVAQPTAIPTRVPVILSVPTAAPELPTATPTQDGSVLGAAPGTEEPRIAAQATVDYSTFREVYPAPSEAAISGAPPGVLGMSITRVRDILIGTLAIGVGFITLGVLAVIRSRRQTRSSSKERSVDGDD